MSQFSQLPFDPAQVPFDYKTSSWTLLEEKNKLYSLAIAYIAKAKLHTEQASSSHSYILRHDKDLLQTTVGLGSFYFQGAASNDLFALHVTVGDPVGTDCGVQVMKSLIIFDPTMQGKDKFEAFFDCLIKSTECHEPNTFNIYNWHIRYSYWRLSETSIARPLESVILPESVKSKLIGDMTKFLGPSAKEFFRKHGIPYRRSYLFWGTPGSGKTSLIQALAGYFKKNVCFLQPTHPEINDDSLREAIQEAPKDSIIVLEDIDALFDKDRNTKAKTPLTFSGLLNALDGVGSPNGQLFILTTNLRDQLDPALIRNGRVDLHVEFTFAVAEQMERLWEAFYPDAADKSTEFARSLIEKLDGKQVSTALLQHFFVTQMDKSAEEALASVGEVLEEIKQRESSAASAEKESSSDGVDAESSTKTDKEDDDEEEDEEEDTSSRGIHVHIHTASKPMKKKSSKKRSKKQEVDEEE